LDGARSVRFGTHAVAGSEYTYHLTFAQVPAGIAWRAIVRDATGALSATPRGLIRDVEARAQDLDARLHEAVARAIETR
jgi:hypothetical protein